MISADDYISEFTAPWKHRRGMAPPFSNHTHVYFECAIQDLQTLFLGKTKTVIPNVLGQRILIDDPNFAIAFQLEEHTWSTLILSQDCYVMSDRKFIERISTITSLKVITLSVSDTSGSVEYRIFDNGKIIEFFSGREDNFDLLTEDFVANKYQFFTDQDDPEYYQTAYFYTRDSIAVPANSTIYSFSSSRFEDYDVYAPDITIEYFFDNQDIQLGTIYQPQSKGFFMSLYSGETLMTHPNFRRVDFYTFYS